MMSIYLDDKILIKHITHHLMSSNAIDERYTLRQRNYESKMNNVKL